MHNSEMKPNLDSSWLSSINQSYIEKLYEDFLINPHSIDAQWHSIFQHFMNNQDQDNKSLVNNISCFFHQQHNLIEYSKQYKVLELINAFRYYGHLNANLDPLDICKSKSLVQLDLSYYDFNTNDLESYFNISSLSMNNKQMKLIDIYKFLKKIYCGSIGVEYMHIDNIQEKIWIQQEMEDVFNQYQLNQDQQKNLLISLNSSEILEKYLGTKFPGTKRFSLEGCDVLIPMIKNIIYESSKNSINEIIIGMAHRGRLNVLVNILGKKSQDIFNEFSGNNVQSCGSGDVKYHMGYASHININDKLINLVLDFNPSHLEIINPVIMGAVRARIDRSTSLDSNNILPITIHGDAAIVGQGVVQETLNMSQTRGYKIGGTIRIVINNQLGFTTSEIIDARSTLYCTDIAKMIQSPVFHVNADDPEAVSFIAKTAVKYRNIFKKDILVDLICYRRHGHNEADEPSVTQPIMYQKINNHPTVFKIYAEYLKKNYIIKQEEIDDIIKNYRKELHLGKRMISDWTIQNDYVYTDMNYNHSNNKYFTKPTIQYLRKLAKQINSIPKNINMQSRVKKIYQERNDMANEKKLLDWGAAENLAYATLLDIGINIRLSGEDSRRGTFFHRHAVIYNQIDNSTYMPLNCIHENQGKFNIWDSVLSEEAVLAFEYGYSCTEPHVLTIWEAQFGDFANGAQIVIDQFISSGEQKWGKMCGLVMLLPHGYEGQGPEHSSARIERYLQLCAENNMQVCVPSTPAQIYHLLRNQILISKNKPLIIMSPKSLLRHPLATSSLKELAAGDFQTVIEEIDLLDSNNVKRIILCSGKIYYDLIMQRRQNKQNNIMIIRIEQLYPFPYESIQKILQKFSHVIDLIWCQEEPLNQGAWHYINNYISKMIPEHSSIQYVARLDSAAPAVGSFIIHQKQQRELINNALDINNCSY